MKKLLLLLSVFSVLTMNVNATKHTVSISELAYSPALLSVHIGDTVTIDGTISHPLLQVSKTTWTNNGTAALSGGFGPTTKSYTFTVTAADTIYYICTAHVQFGMKGRVIVAPLSGINEIPSENFAVALYPNPVTTKATVRLTSPGTGQVKIMLFSMNGQMEKDLTPGLSNQNGDYYCEFDASRMSSGNHFVMVTEGSNRVVKKFEVIK